MKTERDIAQVAFDRAVTEMHPASRITEDKIAAFVDVMRRNVLSGVAKHHSGGRIFGQ